MTVLLAWLLLLATVVCLAALVALHVLPTGLSPVSDPVSAYAITRFKAGYAVAAVSAGIAGAAAALLLGGLPGGLPAAVLLWLFAAARATVPFFPMDAPDAEPSGAGRLHNVLAIMGFATVTVAIFVGAAPLGLAIVPSLFGTSIAAGIVATAGSLGIGFTRVFPKLEDGFGAVERLIYLGFLGWFLAIGVGVLGH
jgi:hypothetical protein